MRIPFLAILCLALVGLPACDIAPLETASAGAAPPIDVPIGPMPGPGKLPELAKNPYTYKDDPPVLQEGRRLFVWYNCAGCHGGHAGGGMGPSLRDKTWLYGSSDAHVFDSIAKGRRMGMPAWGLKLPQDDIWKLVTYIHSLRTAYEPDAPIVAPPKVTVPPQLSPAPEGAAHGQAH